MRLLLKKKGVVSEEILSPLTFIHRYTHVHVCIYTHLYPLHTHTHLTCEHKKYAHSQVSFPSYLIHTLWVEPSSTQVMQETDAEKHLTVTCFQALAVH